MKNYLPLAFCCIIISLASQKLCAQSNLTLEGHLSYTPNTLSNLWGYVDSLGNEYALVGVSTGLSIVDVTNPILPTQKFFVTGDTSYWREVKTYKRRAYITNETGGGVDIISLDSLPKSVTSHFFSDNGRILRAHTLWIDTAEGYLYLFGTNVGNGGAQIYDLNPNPDTPVYAGQYDDYYIHDGFVRGDTLWASHIYAGNLEVVNVTDKAAPSFMAVFNTPGRCTHSSWPTTNDHYIFVTDEVYNSYLSSYDVQKLDTIVSEGVIQADPGSGAIVHNVYLHTNDFATTSYYCQGVVIFDVTYPDNMVEVASYNTSDASCEGLNGCWGEYPYLPSGNIIASDIQNGLYVLKPTYVHACWLAGNVTDTTTTQPIIDTKVTILSTTDTTNSNVYGNYKTGAGDSGLYSIQFVAPGYYPETINNVHLVNGIVDTLNVLLRPLPYFTMPIYVYDSVSTLFINKAQVLFQSNTSTYFDSTDINGYASISNFFPGVYRVFIGKWGYKLFYKNSDTIENSPLNYDVPMQQGYYDDFSLNLGWTDSSTATSGQWVRGVPYGTLLDSEFVNPNATVKTAHDGQCYMTGNSDSGGYYRTSCLYGGYTGLTSPVINLSTYIDPYVSYYTWFFNLPDLFPANDSLVVTISSKDTTKTLQSIKLSNTDTCQWIFQKFRIKDFVSLSDSMYISFFAQNTDSANNVFKAAIDVFQITDSLNAGINTLLPPSLYFSVYPNPFEVNTTVSYNTNLTGNYSLTISDVVGRTVYYKLLNGVKDIVNVDLKNLPAGIYICQLKNNTTILKTVKVAKTN
jgi:choice-of-anchor B domain-containing protein